jgi:hypothetical protein
MAFFFFIGIIFIIIGLVKLFFKRADDRHIFDAAYKSEQTNQFQNLGNQNIQSNQSNQNPLKKDLSVQVDLITPREPQTQNRVEQAVTQMAKAQENTQNHKSHQTHQGTRTLHTGHTNSYARTHHYHGPTKTVNSTAPNAQHPVSSHIQPKVQNMSEHSIRCRKCGTSNTGHANYCHSCGYRLK